MCYKHADLVDYFEIESNGLFGKFFEDLKNKNLERKNKLSLIPLNDDLNVENSAVYVITFNSPNQFETLMKSMELYDRDFIDKPKKFLLDNSSDLTTTQRYVELAGDRDGAQTTPPISLTKVLVSIASIGMPSFTRKAMNSALKKCFRLLLS